MRPVYGPGVVRPQPVPPHHVVAPVPPHHVVAPVPPYHVVEPVPPHHVVPPQYVVSQSHHVVPQPHHGYAPPINPVVPGPVYGPTDFRY